MYDLKITGGTLVDGTGAEPRRADVAVKDGVIVAVGPDLAGEAAETIDATDRLVTPGFVDIHTHYDGQATWDPQLEPSASHGVTTLVTCPLYTSDAADALTCVDLGGRRLIKKKQQ